MLYDDAREQEKLFLREAQAGNLEALKSLLQQHASLIHARSTSKGYTAMHYAAMAGAIPVVEWLAEQGVSVEVESPDGVTPLKVALDYKRLHAVPWVDRGQILRNKWQLAEESRSV